MNGVRKMAAKNEPKEAVLLTGKDYSNIMSWWAHSIEMEKHAERGPIRDSERDTANRISSAGVSLAKREKDVS